MTLVKHPVQGGVSSNIPRVMKFLHSKEIGSVFEADKIIKK